MKSPAPRWLVALAGIAVGLSLGLAYAWLVDPVRATNTYPALLRSDFRQDWVRLAGLAYLADGDLDRLRSRVRGLDSEDVGAELRAVILDHGSADGGGEAARRAVAMADAFEVAVEGTPTPEPSPTSGPTPRPSPTPTPSSMASATPAPASTPVPPTPSQVPATPSATLEPPSAISFRVVQREHVCLPQAARRVEIVVRDAEGEGLRGVRVWLLWDDGADWAVTGLMPDRGSGYADFDVEAGVRYSVGVGDIGMPLLSDLQILACTDDEGGSARAGSWRIVVEQRPDEGSGT